jgi:hypothetical protein
MNTYEINWQETILKSVTVMGTTREEAMEAFKSGCHTKLKTRFLTKQSPSIIQVVAEREHNA